MKQYATTSQLILWVSEFGAEYTDRNNVELPGRMRAWADMMEGVEARRILEVGCNVGWNLTYLSRLGDYELVGIEPQDYALQKARRRAHGFTAVQGNAFDIPFDDGAFDLVFTSGVLIHVHGDDLDRAMAEIYRTSRRYILYIEYDDDTEVEVPYRDRGEALWRRNHRAHWLRNFPQLRLLRSGSWGKEHDHDDTTWCLFEKPEAEQN